MYSTSSTIQKKNLRYDKVFETYYKIFVAGELVLKEKLAGQDKEKKIEKSLTRILEQYYDKIILQEKINAEKLIDLEYYGCYKTLAQYYRYRDKNRYFHFVKKLSKTNLIYLKIYNKINKVPCDNKEKHKEF